ncbi:MAG: hypothetical protein IPG50_08675 [Myxococcales bacterium]|nr:hypothetical protein [Myxococcales bacterium]
MRSADETPTSSRPRGQAFRAAAPLGEFGEALEQVVNRIDLVDTLAERERVFGDLLVDLAGDGSPERRPPESGTTAIGPLGPSTQRAIRTLDPREPSLEPTRLDLFVAPAAPEAAPRDAASPSPRVQFPPSYRTRVGPYFVPRDPATEPSLSVDDVDAAEVVPSSRPRSFWSRLRKRVRRIFHPS